jgi:hypothetical protein
LKETYQREQIQQQISVLSDDVESPAAEIDKVVELLGRLVAAVDHIHLKSNTNAPDEETKNIIVIRKFGMPFVQEDIYTAMIFSRCDLTLPPQTQHTASKSMTTS